MNKKKSSLILAITGAFFLAGCPDGTSTTEQPEQNNSGEITDITEENIKDMIVLFQECTECKEVHDDALVPGSGVAYNQTTETLTYTSYDISGLSFNTTGFQTLSGTVSLNGPGGDLAFDLTVTGAVTWHIQFILEDSNPLTVTINGTVYKIDFYVEEEPQEMPENWYNGNEAHTSSVVHTPRWPDVSQRISVPSDSAYCSASSGEALVASETPYAADFSYNGKSYPFSCKGWADVNSSGPGNVSMQAGSRLNVTGINFLNASSDMEYQAFGTAFYDAYFSVLSDNPETTRVKMTFSVSSGAHLTYSIDETNHYATSFTSLTADADIYRMAWRNRETGGYWWGPTDHIAGGGSGEAAGYAVIGFTDYYGGRGTGMFQGQIEADSDDVTVTGTEVLTCVITPETEMFSLSLSIMARSISEFTGIHTGLEGEAVAVCENAEMSYTYTAVDPDHPDANITVKFYPAP